jgi:hypothetical protein
LDTSELRKLEKVPLFNEYVEGSGGSWKERHGGGIHEKASAKKQKQIQFFLQNQILAENWAKGKTRHTHYRAL